VKIFSFKAYFVKEISFKMSYSQSFIKLKSLTAIRGCFEGLLIILKFAPHRKKLRRPKFAKWDNLIYLLWQDFLLYSQKSKGILFKWTKLTNKNKKFNFFIFVINLIFLNYKFLRISRSKLTPWKFLTDIFKICEDDPNKLYIFWILRVIAFKWDIIHNF